MPSEDHPELAIIIPITVCLFIIALLLVLPLLIRRYCYHCCGGHRNCPTACLYTEFCIETCRRCECGDDCVCDTTEDYTDVPKEHRLHPRYGYRPPPSVASDHCSHVHRSHSDLSPPRLSPPRPPISSQPHHQDWASHCASDRTEGFVTTTTYKFDGARPQKIRAEARALCSEGAPSTYAPSSPFTPLRPVRHEFAVAESPAPTRPYHTHEYSI